jgi:ligand-binding sensor protein
MSTDHNLSIRDLIDESQLSAVQEMMCHFINLSVVTVDADGRLLSEHTKATSPCPMSSDNETCTFTCIKSKSFRSATVTGNPISHICECKWGIKNCVSPIIVENVYLGSVIIGHFLTEGTDYNLNRFNLSRLGEIPIIPEIKMLKMLEYGNFTSGHIAEIAAKRITEYKLHAETQEKLRHYKERQKAQLKTLSAQINPHFLFNTLNSITRMAYLEDAENTKEMTYCLSDLLRYTLKQTEEFPTIGSEMDNIRRYLHIQDIRYNDRIHYHIDIPSQILECRIPAMLLQPIVENALIHGLEPKVEGGSVFITSEVVDSSIIIRVRDTGIGIKPRKLKDFFTEDLKSSAGLGIRNSHLRLQQYFGPDYGLKITSTENVETIVEIKLPYFKELAPLHHN